MLLFALVSCNSNNSDSKKDTENQDNSLATGVINASVECKSNKEFTYAYYLPSSYNAQKKYPLIIAFDAQARGQLAVSKFKDAAEQNGYIVVGSNLARNGLRDLNPVVNSLWEDVISRFSIDNTRIYTAGFSGGARIAASIAIYKGGVQGVIGCGGGMPTVGQEIGKKFDFIGIVGADDFNYQEMKTLNASLNKNNFTNQLLIFEGGHHWPPQNMLSKALQWLDLMKMKRGELPIDDNLVRTYTSKYADSINNALYTGKSFKAYELYNVLLKDLDGLYDISDYKKSYQALLNNPEVKAGIKTEEIEKKKELDTQEQLLEDFKSSSFLNIKNIIADLKNNNANNSINKRLLGFVGMLCYLYTENAVNSQNIKDYNGFLEIYELIEPKNPDKECFKACQAMMNGKRDLAMQYLQTAVKFGFYDFRKLQTIGYFEELRTQPEFDILVQKAMQNAMK